MEAVNVIISICNIFAGILTIGLCIPMMKGKVKMNPWYGARFRKSYESEEAWYKINAYCGRRMVYWSIVLILIGILALFIPLGEAYLLRTLLFASAALILIIPCFETLRYSKTI